MGSDTKRSGHFAAENNWEIMENEIYHLGGIKPEMAQKILAKNGIEVDLEEAKNILELLIFLVNLSMDQILDQE